MSNEKLYRLIVKYREGKCTPDELAKLDSWYEEQSDDAECIGAVPREKLDQLLYGIELRSKNSRPIRKSITPLRWIAVGCAAAVAATLFFIYTPEDKNIGDHSPVAESWRAELITGNGSRLPLDGTPIIEENGMMIASNSDRGLEYSTDNQIEGIAEMGSIQHTIVVPLGCEYGLTLSDGSRVRLNSGSVLTYPVSFGDEKREVILKGEGYFDVAKSDVPFIVNASSVSVRVLGTSFNVTAYDDDGDITTTLVSGNVSVRIGDGEQEHALTPGNQLSYDKVTQNVTHRVCDADIETAWIRGEFKFRDMRLDEILKRLGRWYDYEVRFDDEAMKYQRFSGAAEKNRPVEYVLDIMEHVTDIKFSIKNNIIIVEKIK